MMITFTLKKTREDDPDVLCLGFSHENLERLKEGYPIRVAAERLDPKLNCKEVLIFSGETEESMAATLQEWIKTRGAKMGKGMDVDITDYRGGQPKTDEEIDDEAREEVEGDLHDAGIAEDPDIDGGLLG